MTPQGISSHAWGLEAVRIGAPQLFLFVVKGYHACRVAAVCGKNDLAPVVLSQARVGYVIVFIFAAPYRICDRNAAARKIAHAHGRVLLVGKTDKIARLGGPGERKPGEVEHKPAVGLFGTRESAEKSIHRRSRRKVGAAGYHYLFARGADAPLVFAEPLRTLFRFGAVGAADEYLGRAATRSDV